MCDQLDKTFVTDTKITIYFTGVRTASTAKLVMIIHRKTNFTIYN